MKFLRFVVVRALPGAMHIPTGVAQEPPVGARVGRVSVNPTLKTAAFDVNVGEQFWVLCDDVAVDGPVRRVLAHVAAETEGTGRFDDYTVVRRSPSVTSTGRSTSTAARSLAHFFLQFFPFFCFPDHKKNIFVMSFAKTCVLYLKIYVPTKKTTTTVQLLKLHFSHSFSFWSIILESSKSKHFPPEKR